MAEVVDFDAVTHVGAAGEWFKVTEVRASIVRIGPSEQHLVSARTPDGDLLVVPLAVAAFRIPDLATEATRVPLADMEPAFDAGIGPSFLETGEFTDRPRPFAEVH